MMHFRMTAAAIAAFALAGGALAQTPPAPAGMTLDQFQAAGRSRLLERDADGDGRISAAEFAAGGGGRRGKPASAEQSGAGNGEMAARMFKRFDSNGDGMLDKAEIDAMLQRRFERLDANHDGVVTADERQSAHNRMRPEQ